MKQQTAWIWGLIIVIIAGILLYNFYTPSTPSPATDTTATSTDTSGGTNNGTTAMTGAKPVVNTTGFASVSSTTAVVVGTVIPNGAATTYWFEYGTTMNYGSSVDAMSAPASYKELGAAGYLTGLEPSTEYYFRIGARNAYGTTYSGQYKFITKAD